VTARSHLAVCRSGAQDGVDIAALRAAASLGLPTAGTMPLGFRTHGGPRPEYRELYGCDEHASPDWAPRTRVNVERADATLRLAEHPNSPGERCTANACKEFRRPCFDVLLVREGATLAPVASDREKAIAGLRRLAVDLGRPLHLNVAGNSEKTSPGIEAAAEPVLRALLARVAAPLRVATGRIDCGDRDALDVSRAGASRARSRGVPFPGEPFAPSWEILKPALDARTLAKIARSEGRAEDAALLEAAAWERYVPAFEAEMRVSYGVPPDRMGQLEREASTRPKSPVRPDRRAWLALLARERVVLTCFCVAEEGEPLRCHRRLLAGILVKCGAVDEGEVPGSDTVSSGAKQVGLAFSDRADH